MVDLRLTHLFSGLLAALVVGSASTPAHAFYEPAVFGKSGELFAREEPVGSEELNDMRGGFVTSNGMVIDFTFSANTLIDGQLINQIVLNTADPASNAGALRSIIQAGEGNTAFSNVTNISNLPNVLTIVQNNLDNLTIQQLNVLDLQVQNMGNFINQSVTPEINFQSSLGLAP